MKSHVVLIAVIAAITFAHACSNGSEVAKSEPQKPEELVALTGLMAGKFTAGTTTNLAPQKQDQDAIEFLKDSGYIVSNVNPYDGIKPDTMLNSRAHSFVPVN